MEIINMNFFDTIKKTFEMKNKFNEIDKKLNDIIVEVEYKGIKIKANAKNEFLNLNISENLFNEEKEKIEENILNAFRETIKKIKIVMFDEAKKITIDSK
jgi:DNA-binding protein YbaB